MTPFRPTAAAAVLGLCIALGPTLAGFFIYKGIKEAKLGDRYVTVKGLVERIERSDRGTWEITFKVSGNELNALYDKLASDAEIVNVGMQLIPVGRRSRILGYEAVSYDHDRLYGYVPERGSMFGISQHGEMA